MASQTPLAKYLRRMREEVKQVILAAKTECVDCGEDDWRCLDFDHRDPNEKKFGISRATTICASKPGIARLKVEIAKCDVRCANCHRKRSYDEGHMFIGWNRANGG